MTRRHLLRPIAALALAAGLSLGSTGSFAQTGPGGFDVGTAEAADYLQTFTGRWRGNGVLRESPRREPAPVVCRADGSIGANGVLNVGGRCGGEGFTGTFNVAAVYQPASDSYVATWSNALSGTVQMTGRRNGHQVVFSVPAVAGYPGARLTLVRQSESNFRIRAESVSAGGGSSFVSADIQLARQ